MTGEQIANLVAVGNQSALQWYSTVTQKPIGATGPESVMGNVFGTDFRGGPTVIGQTVSPFGVVMMFGIVAVAVVLIFRR
jgi:hypothetical protein